MTSTPVSPTKIEPWSRLRALHVFVLCAFAFTQPLLSALTQQTVYIHDHDVGWPEVAVLLFVLSVLVPFSCVLADRMAMRWSSRWGGRGRNVVLLILSGFVVLSLLRPWCVQVEWLAHESVVWLCTLVIALPGTWLLVRLYERTRWLRHWLTVASAGLLLFPVLFLWQLSGIRQTPTELYGHIPAENPVPVVFIVFDEFSGTTLMNEDLQIDSQRYPQFARLAALSTWYRQATTVHPRTDVVVPAMLSGRFPVTRRSPLEIEYPGNLFQIIQATDAYDMVVFEPITRLCPLSVRHRPRAQRTGTQRTADLLRTLAAVYPRLVLPGDTPITFPVIPKAWFGLRESPPDDWNQTQGLFRYDGFSHRTRQLHHFLDCLRPSDRPRFSFLHVELPHLPWCFLPSGGQYVPEIGANIMPDGARGELGEDWDSDPAIVLRNEYRYRQQVGYVDRFLGQLLDHLRDIEVLDRCLLIVTADHGVSFRPGHSRRVPDANNLPDILSVPLFVKLPGQMTGRVDDRNVESVDLLPTIAEVLDIALPEPVDGVSVSHDVRRPRKTLYFDGGMTVMEPIVPQLKAAVQRQRLWYGTAALEHPPAQASSHSDWHGRSIRDFVVEDRPLTSVSVDTITPVGQAEESRFVPRLVTGSLDPRDLSESSADLVLAVDGHIRDTGKSYWINYGRHGFQFFLPETVATLKPGHAELFLVEPSTEALPRLRRLSRWTLWQRQ